jgi:hypothetical protein
MATSKRDAPDDATTGTNPKQTPPTSGGPGEAILIEPLVLKRLSKKRDKKKYTKGTKQFQRLTLGLTKGGYRASNSLTKGLNTFFKRSNKSARKRRDGLVRDSLRNASRGVGDGFTSLGKAPFEVARRVSTRRVWKNLKRVPIFPFGR